MYAAEVENVWRGEQSWNRNYMVLAACKGISKAMEAYELMAVLEDVEGILEPFNKESSKEELLSGVTQALQLIAETTEEFEVEEEEDEDEAEADEEFEDEDEEEKEE